MQFQESDLDQLKQALISGVTSISVEGRTVTFQSLDQIAKTIQMIEEQIARQESEENNEEYIKPNLIKASFKR